MKIGILQAGAPPAALAERFGTYGNMFRRLLGPAFKFDIFEAQSGVLPSDGDGCEAYLITGSSSGVYDGEDWIKALEGFVRARIGAAPMMGICFGHQLMAQALGGQVVQSHKGWGIGLHRYEIKARAPWMDAGGAFALPVSHQDQVAALGPDGRLLAGNDFTAYGMVDYPRLRAMSMQPHPEFEPEYAKALIETRRDQRIGADAAESAINSLKEPNDRRRVEVWLRRFLNTA